MFIKSKYAVLLAIIMLSAPFSHADYSTHAAAGAFVDKMVTEHKFEREFVVAVLQSAEKKQSIIDAISRPAEKTKPWKEYKDIFLGEDRMRQGVEFWQANKKTLDKASKEFGVPAEMIVAIIGVETRYGKHKGTYRVIDALTTLGFDYEPRATFFSKELEHFFLLTREQKQDPLKPVGSYAGAMGYGQFIPSSYRSYAIDYDDDELVDIWENPVDAIGSVANYFSRHGWESGELVLTRTHIKPDYDADLINAGGRPSLTLAELEAKGFTPVDKSLPQNLQALPLMYEGVYGKEFWLGYKNFYVITRYNRSRLYAMAAWQLSQNIREAYDNAELASAAKKS